MVSFKKREIDKGELYHKMIFGFDKDKFKWLRNHENVHYYV